MSSRHAGQRQSDPSVVGVIGGIAAHQQGTPLDAPQPNAVPQREQVFSVAKADAIGP